MKLYLTPSDMQLLQSYGIVNFLQLKEVYAITGDTRLLHIINASVACITANLYG